jgi:NADH-quinone oxidoreductase subunit C
MDDHLLSAVMALRGRFGAEMEEFRGEISLSVPSERALRAVQVLHDEYGFDFLIDSTVVDYWPALEPRFHVVHHLYATGFNEVLCVRIPLNGSAPVLHTLEGIYPNANWKEREIWDLFGIRFEGHSDLRRILLPFDWQGHPLRKDHPLGYEEPQYSFNYQEIQRRKPAGRLTPDGGN